MKTWENEQFRKKVDRNTQGNLHRGNNLRNQMKPLKPTEFDKKKVD